MVFFCAFSASPLVGEVREALHGLNGSVGESSPIVGAVISRLFLCGFFAWLAVMLGRKNRKASHPR